MSITQNKSLNPLLNLLINCKPARSAPRILSIKGECTFLFLKFLIIVLCNSAANSLFEIFSVLIADLFRVAKASDRASVEAPPEYFYQKIYKSLKQYLFDIHHIMDF